MQRLSKIYQRAQIGCCKVDDGLSIGINSGMTYRSLLFFLQLIIMLKKKNFLYASIIDINIKMLFKKERLDQQIKIRYNFSFENARIK
ncbi:unnamed protein product [Paramecium octaurelia]|uniref:Uncharacterized protein n=1 Tax=Paramecium octaurelia TaxID=43137 RepID=A0A8S1YP96_PAROT|nr:unnamed protein product [Paramecium octaurelia]